MIVMSNQKVEYTEGGGNVYQDIGFSDAEERMAKARLALRIEAIIEERGLKQVEAAKILGINQPKISALMNGRLSGFAMERLIHFLNLLNQNVEIVVTSRPGRHKSHGHLKVAFG